MTREYITGWFSPSDHEVMAIFYEIDESRGSSFEAEILRNGSVIQVFRGNSLPILQNDVLNGYGGGLPNEPGPERPEVKSRKRVLGLLRQRMASLLRPE